jgi:hypothetical protein
MSFSDLQLSGGSCEASTDIFAEVASLFRNLVVPRLQAADVARINADSSAVHAGAFRLTVAHQAESELLQALSAGTLSASLQPLLAVLGVLLSIDDCAIVRLLHSCDSSGGDALPRALLRILTSSAPCAPSTQQLLGKLIGRACAPGMQSALLVDLLTELQQPGAPVQALLSALKYAAGGERLEERRHSIHDDSSSQATELPDFFSFTGPGSSMQLQDTQWLFPSEYQIAVWLRFVRFPDEIVAENSSSSSSSSSSNTSSAQEAKAHIITLLTAAGAGIDVYVQDRCLCIATSDSSSCSSSASRRGSRSSGAAVTVIFGAQLQCRQWHSLVITHKMHQGKSVSSELFGSSSSSSSSSNDVLSVVLDGEEVFNKPCPYPPKVSLPHIFWRLLRKALILADSCIAFEG